MADKLDILTLDSIPNSLAQEILRALIEAVGGDRSKLERLLKPSADGDSNLFEAAVRESLEKLEPTIQTYLIPIEIILRTLSEKEAFRVELRRQYDYVNPEITHANFFPKKEEAVLGNAYRTEAPEMPETLDGEVMTVHYGRIMTTQEVLADLDRRDLRPATLEELHSLGKAQPDLQRQFSIVALGSGLARSGGSVVVPILYGRGSGRRLGIYWAYPQNQWDPDYRFLALHK